jgi:hypothetical protein
MRKSTAKVLSLVSGAALAESASTDAVSQPAGLYSISGATGPITGYQGLCLDDRGAGTASTASTALFNPIRAYTCTCNGTAAQVWQHQSNGELLNPNSGKCLNGFIDHTGNPVNASNPVAELISYN